MSHVSPTELRARFAARLSELYGTEVPAYNLLVDVSQQVNERAMSRHGSDAERLGSIARVTAERHGAIRVGTPRELSQVARVFGAMGMYPTGFYDLRDARPAPIPVISTAFRPIDRDELAQNPFRVFTSMLVPEDRRFFDAELEARLKEFLAARELFPARLLELADRGEQDGRLGAADAEEFLDLAVAAFALSSDPVDRTWYETLERISNVASDIGGVSSTHINHLTPRVLDIDDLYASMTDLGIAMIDRVQGPPRWEGPDVLLRQTSFRALSETRFFKEPDGAVVEGSLRVRFGEVESRGIALTRAGRDLYDHLVGLVDQRAAASPERSREDVAVEVWRESMPATEEELRTRGLGFFTYHLVAVPADGMPEGTLEDLIARGCVEARPIVYEDFLPRSAAGIFASNLSDEGAKDESQRAAVRDAGWLAEAIGRQIRVPEELYGAESAASIAQIEHRLGRSLAVAEVNA